VTKWGWRCLRVRGGPQKTSHLKSSRGANTKREIVIKIIDNYLTCLMSAHTKRPCKQPPKKKVWGGLGLVGGVLMCAFLMDAPWSPWCAFTEASSSHLAAFRVEFPLSCPQAGHILGFCMYKDDISSEANWWMPPKLCLPHFQVFFIHISKKTWAATWWFEGTKNIIINVIYITNFCKCKGNARRKILDSLKILKH